MRYLPSVSVDSSSPIRPGVHPCNGNRGKKLDAPSWLWTSVVQLVASHEAAFLNIAASMRGGRREDDEVILANTATFTSARK
jgi:hypothetical protein